MTDAPQLLQIGKITDRMRESVAADWMVTELDAQADRSAFLDERGPDFLGILTMKGVAEDVAIACPNLKVVSSFGVGYDNVDAAGLSERGVLVAHTPDVLNGEVADTTLMLWMAVSRRLIESERWARSGEWERKGAFPLTRSIRGRTVGIVGLGRIGQTIAELAVGTFGATVLYHARSEKPDLPYTFYGDLVEMAQASEVLIVITPGGPETEHLIDRKVMDALGPEGILINVARGSVVDEAALVEALRAGTLGAAGLDVFEEEPKIADGLKEMDQVVLLPHVGSATVETRQAMGDLVCENLAMFIREGRVKTPVPECRHLNG